MRTNIIELPRPVEPGRGRMVLTVGELGREERIETLQGQVAFADIHDVGPEMLDSLRPDIVLSPLLCRSFDCIDLAQILQAAGFRGRYRAISPELPSPDLIRREIQALCPDIRFDVIIIDDFRKLALPV